MLWLSAGQMCAADILCIDLRETHSCLSFPQCGVFLCWLLWEKYLFLSHPLTASHRGDAEIYCVHTQCGNLVHALNQRLVHLDKKQPWRPCAFSCRISLHVRSSHMKRECDQNIVNRKWLDTGYPDKAVVSIATPSCETSQPIRGETLTEQEVMFTTLPEHAITSLIGFISMHAHSGFEKTHHG